MTTREAGFERGDDSPYAGFRLVDCVETIPFPGWRRLLLPIAEKHAETVDTGIAEHVRIFGNEMPIAPYSPEMVFRAFHFFDVDDTKAVIIGQDCYPTPGQATGLCFSVPDGMACPPSLRNIFKEVERPDGVPGAESKRRKTTDLSDWAAQGVLLLNTALTVRCHAAGSHLRFWSAFTKDVVRAVARETVGVAFLLWGAHAHEYETVVPRDRRHLVLKHTHPSPLSRKPFEGCGHFAATNAHLRATNRPTIAWL